MPMSLCSLQHYLKELCYATINGWIEKENLTRYNTCMQEDDRLYKGNTSINTFMGISEKQCTKWKKKGTKIQK